MTRRWQGVWLVTALVVATSALLASGCGDDEGGAAATKPNTPAKKKAAGGRGARGKNKGGQLDTYSQIDPRYRQPFSEIDFTPDPGGDENRDPFRSYVIPQGETSRSDGKGSTIQPTDICTEKNSRASAYSVRELRLIGIVLRGTRSFAQFRDPNPGQGHIVTVGDCIGKEKAMVEKIGAGFVTLEVVPEAAANTEAQSERRDIQLHPTDLQPSEESLEPPPPAPAPAAPATP